MAKPIAELHGRTMGDANYDRSLVSLPIQKAASRRLHRPGRRSRRGGRPPPPQADIRSGKPIAKADTGIARRDFSEVNTILYRLKQIARDEDR
jgi:hypothetical protein